MAQNGSNSSQNFDFLTQKFKMAQTHLKSFNGRQGGILQSISGVSGASGGLKSQNFDFLTQKFKMAVFARFHFLKSKNPISGHNQARLTSGDPQNKLLLMIKFSPGGGGGGFFQPPPPAYRPRRNYGGYMRRLRRLYEKLKSLL